MDWLQIASIIGAVAGLSSFLAIVLTYVTKLSKMETKIDLIWKVFVEDALRAQVKIGILSHSSPYTLSSSSAQYSDLVSSETLQKLQTKNISSDYQLVEEYIKCVGFDEVFAKSRERHMSNQEYLAICVGAIHSKTDNRVM